MLTYSNSTVFNVEAQTIVNTINCEGVMGAGIALEFKMRYPKMFEDYASRCERREVRIGEPYLFQEHGYPWILNFPTKKHWKYPSKMEWIQQGLEHFTAHYQGSGVTSIAFPMLGTNNGHLEWAEVKKIMNDHLGDLNINVQICLDAEREASGVEGSIVSRLNDPNDRSWIDELRLRQASADKIVAALPVSRFRELAKIKGIGEQTYSNVFRHFYNQVSTATKLQPSPESALAAETRQLSLTF
jgi:O-acetyl-ADP-ribose deacetylase (regulator of RNase III)